PEEVLRVRVLRPGEDRIHVVGRRVLRGRVVRGDDRSEDRHERGNGDDPEAEHRGLVAAQPPERVLPQRSLLAREDVHLDGALLGRAGGDRCHLGRYFASLIRGSSTPYTMSTLMLATMMRNAYSRVVAMMTG